MKHFARFSSLLSLIAAFGFVALLLVFLGETPSLLLSALKNSLFTGYGLGHTLYYTTSLIFCGLGIALAGHAGLFNIGAEGQLYLGSLGVLWLAALLPGLSAPAAFVCCFLAAFVAGGLWGGIAGAMKAWRGSHEVIVTILLNFVGISLTSYCILYPLKNHEEQGPESILVPPSFEVATLDSTLQKLSNGAWTWLDSTPANYSLVIALVLTAALHFFLFRSVLGFELRAVGHNQPASRFAGIPIRSRVFLSLFLAGGLSGLVALNDVLGYHHRLIDGFSPGYGFTAIAVALLARNRPLLIPLSALLFGALHNSTREIEFMSERVSKELSTVLQGIVVAFVSAEGALKSFLEKQRGGTGT